MARESVGIPISSAQPFEASAAFLAVLAHPDDQNQRGKFYHALCKYTLKQMAIEDELFSATKIPLPPAYFMLSDKDANQYVKAGMSQISNRIAAGVDAHPFFDDFIWKKNNTRIMGFERTIKNIRIKTSEWLGRKDGTTEKNITTRIVTPARPVIHAAYALAGALLYFQKNGLSQDTSEGLRLITHNAEYLHKIIDNAHFFAIIAPQISELRVSEIDLIHFEAH